MTPIFLSFPITRGTTAFKKLSSIRKFILNVQQILGSHELKSLTIFDHAHSKIIESIFNLSEFVPVRKKAVYFICSFLLEPRNQTGHTHF